MSNTTITPIAPTKSVAVEELEKAIYELNQAHDALNTSYGDDRNNTRSYYGARWNIESMNPAQWVAKSNAEGGFLNFWNERLADAIAASNKVAELATPETIMAKDAYDKELAQYQTAVWAYDAAVRHAEIERKNVEFMDEAKTAGWVKRDTDGQTFKVVAIENDTALLFNAYNERRKNSRVTLADFRGSYSLLGPSEWESEYFNAEFAKIAK